ncbi:MAG: ATP-binding protein [Pseudomonadota bacterium]
MTDESNYSIRTLRTIALVAPGAFVLVAVAKGSWSTAVPLSVFTLFTAMLFVFRRGKAQSVTLHLFIFSLVLYQTLLLRGTTDEPNIGLIWFLAIPTLVALLGNRLHIVIWTPLIVALLVYNWSLYSQYPSMAHPLSLWNLIGTALMISAAAFGIITQRDRRQKALSEALDDAKAEANRRQRAQTELTTANAAITRFLGSISHELRTPLASILASAEVIEHQTNDPDERRWTGNIRESANALIVLLNDVIELARSESDRETLNEGRFSVQGIADGVAAIMQSMAQTRECALFIGVMPDTHANWIGDGARLRQVVTNLINNAFTHSSAEIVWLTIEESDGRLQFEVGDDGVGISKSDQEQIFQPFQRLTERAVDRRLAGTGLGLAICKGYVEAMGGQITVVSAPGEGARFQFSVSARAVGPQRLLDEYPKPDHSPSDVVLISPCERALRWARRWLQSWDINPDSEVGQILELPQPSQQPLITLPELRRALSVDTNARATRQSSTARRAGNGPQWNIVLCDDDERIAIAFRELFALHGHTMHHASTGQALLDHVTSEDCDAILLDLNLGAESGFDVLRQIRALPSTAGQIPVCILSGNLNEQPTCMEAGADYYLSKPCLFSELLSAIEAMLSTESRASA